VSKKTGSREAALNVRSQDPAASGVSGSFRVTGRFPRDARDYQKSCK
jgi:hypothetical protein